MLELHVIIRGVLADAHRKGVVSRNVAALAAAPKLRAIPPVEPRAWTEDQLKLFLRAAAGHRFYPAFRLAASTGMRRSELLGLKWSDVDWKRGTVSNARGLVAIALDVPRRRRWAHPPRAYPNRASISYRCGFLLRSQSL